jgi:hypothetical protein
MAPQRIFSFQDPFPSLTSRIESIRARLLKLQFREIDPVLLQTPFPKRSKPFFEAYIYLCFRIATYEVERTFNLLTSRL